MNTLSSPASRPTPTEVKDLRVLMLVENCAYLQDVRVRHEAESLVRGGYRVSVICPSSAGRRWREECDGVLVYRFPAPPPGKGFLGYFWEYGYSLAAMFVLSFVAFIRPGFDVIHAANPPDTAVFIGAFYKLLGKRFVYDQHDLAPELYLVRFTSKPNRIIYRVLTWLESLSCRLADHVIATNQSYKTCEMQRGHVPEQRITIVRNGPDLSSLRPLEPLADEPQPGKTQIVYVGRTGFQDGVDYLLRALKLLISDYHRTDFVCTIVGAGDALPGLRALTHQLGLASYVRYTGWLEQADVARYMLSAEICVAPEPSNIYNDRSTMIKMTEYMAFRKPIVAFDLPEHRFTAQNAAAYARPNDELDFARQIVLLMDDPARRRMMGCAGRKRVETELAWPYQEKQLLAAYERLDLRESESRWLRNLRRRRV